MNTTNTKIPVYFWIIGVVLLVWNAMGVMAYFQQNMMSAESIALLPTDQQALYANFPLWANIAFAVAVFGGFIGALGLVLKKKWAYIAFIVSFVGVVIQMYYNFAIAKALDVYGPGGLIMPIMIIVLLVFSIWFSKWSTNKGWLK